MTAAYRHRLMTGATLATTAGLALLALAACDRSVKQAQAQASTPNKPANNHLVVLPDSAIAVQPGSPEEQLAEFLASTAPAPRTFRFEGTEFAPWASAPTPATERTMYVMTQVLRAYPKSHVTLVGYTDNEGTLAQNRLLASQRVDRLAAILVHGGIRASRIETVGKGAVEFIGDNATLAGRARNRRIEVIVTAK